MNDLFLVLFAPIIIVLLGAIYQVWSAWLTYKSDATNDCSHQFDRWERPYQTAHAYVQQRTCKQCGLTQTLQQEKITNGH